MNIGALLRKTYFEKNELTPEDYIQSRRFFIIEGSTAASIFSLTSGAFLAGFASYMGASDQFNGIIGALPVLAGVVQVLASVVFEKMEQRKFLISVLCFCFRMMLGLMLFIPLFIRNSSVGLWSLGITYGVAYVIASFITPAASNWIVSLTPASIRGNYLAKKDAVSLGLVTILTLAMGKVLDIFREYNNEYGGFIAVGMLVMVLAIGNFIAISSVKEPKITKNPNTIRIKDVMTVPFQSLGFRKVIIMFILWNVGLQVAGPFFSVYMVTGLKLDYTYITFMGVITSLVRVFTTAFWGKMADKKSWFFSTKFSIITLALTHSIWFLVNKNTGWILIPLLHVMGGFAWAGIGISLFNIPFLYAKKEGRTMYLGLNAAIGGIAGFTSTLIGSSIVGALEDFSLQLFGLSISNMQIVFLLSGMILSICSLFIYKFMERANDPIEAD